MENGPLIGLIDDFPIKPSIYKGFSMAMLNNQRVPFFFLVIYSLLRCVSCGNHPADVTGLQTARDRPSGMLGIAAGLRM